MSNVMTFHDRARAVLRDYIRSVVLVDDRWPQEARHLPEAVALDPAVIDDPPSEISEADAEGIKPLAFSGDEAGVAASESNDDHELLHVQAAVMESGIIFAGVRYVAADEQRRKAVQKLALRSDVLILDWNLAGNDGGEIALDLLKYLRSRESGPRFVYIFTQSDDLAGIAERIWEQFANGDRSSRPRENGIDFSTGGFSFAVRRKANSGETDQQGSVKAADLIEDALNALVKAKSGLLDMALVELTTRHRWHLNSMIERIGSRYDAALLVEHAFDGSLDLTQGTIQEILFDEWLAQLAERPQPELRILSPAGLEAFLAGLNSTFLPALPEITDLVKTATGKYEGVRTARRESDSKKVSNAVLSRDEKSAFRSFKKGLKAALGSCRIKRDLFEGVDNADLIQVTQQLTEWLSSINSLKTSPFTSSQRLGPRRSAAAVLAAFRQSDGLVDPEVEYLKLQSLLTQRRHLPSGLTQGTVFRLEGHQDCEYLICTTPLCDAFEPAKVKNNFTFLMAKSVELPGLKKFALDNGRVVVVRPHESGDRRGPPIILGISQTPVVCFHIDDPGLSDESPTVEARAWPSDPQARTFRLTAVAQLRRDHAFHVASRALGQAGRIGLDHVEFLRNFSHA